MYGDVSVDKGRGYTDFFIEKSDGSYIAIYTDKDSNEVEVRDGVAHQFGAKRVWRRKKGKKS